jgi:hypothetical protein
MVPLAPIEPLGEIWGRGAAGAFEILFPLARRLRVSGEQGDEAFDLGLSVADEAGAYLVLESSRTTAQ